MTFCVWLPPLPVFSRFLRCAARTSPAFLVARVRCGDTLRGSCAEGAGWPPRSGCRGAAVSSRTSTGLNPCFRSLVCVLGRTVAGSNVLRLLSTCRTVFRSGCAILQPLPRPQRGRAPVSPQPHGHSVVVVSDFCRAGRCEARGCDCPSRKTDDVEPLFLFCGS